MSSLKLHTLAFLSDLLRWKIPLNISSHFAAIWYTTLNKFTNSKWCYWGLRGLIVSLWTTRTFLIPSRSLDLYTNIRAKTLTFVTKKKSVCSLINPCSEWTQRFRDEITRSKQSICFLTIKKTYIWSAVMTIGSQTFGKQLYADITFNRCMFPTSWQISFYFGVRIRSY